MKVGEKHLPFAQHLAFIGLRLFDFDNHLAVVKKSSNIASDRSACRTVIRIRCTNAFSGLPLYNDLVAMSNDFTNACRRESDAIFVIFSFFGDADLHGYVGCLSQ